MTQFFDKVPLPQRGVGTQAILLALSTGLAQVISAVLYVLAARSTNPPQFGEVVAAIALGTFFVGLIDFGTNGLWVREIARGRLDQRELGRRLYLKIVIAAMFAIGFALGSRLLFPASSYWMAAPVGLALLINQTAQVPLRGMARAELVSLSILTDRLIAGLVLVALMQFGVEAYSGLWLALTSGSIAASVMGWSLTPQGRRPQPSLALRINPWRDAQYYGLNTLSISAQSLDLPVLAFAGGPMAAGLYGAVNRWTQPMGLLASAFSSASAPFVARSPSWSEAWTHVRRGLWLLGTAMVGCLVVVVLAPFVVGRIIGGAYEQSAVVLQILALATIPAIVNQPLAVFLQSMGYDKPVAMVTLGSVTLQLAVIALSASAFGAIGAAAGLGLVQLCILASFSMIATRAFRRHRSTRSAH